MDAGERFQIQKRLGSGASGDVFHALDRQTGGSVAIKTLRRVSADALLRFKTEFRALQDLEHPHVVHFGELIQREREWFFTMELVEGVSLKDWIAPDVQIDDSLDTADIHCNEARLRDALRQLCAALAAIHDAGLVHRDVKPSNIRVTPGGKLILLDFGLVADASGDSDGSIVGTPIYMAPEQARSAPVDAKADMYAVGVILFEAIAGAPPFVGNPFHLLVRKQKVAPPALRDVVPHAPEELDVLCSALLSQDPDARPTAREVEAILGTIPERTTARRKEQAPFVGRVDELLAIEAAYERSRSQFSALVIEGPSGIGKSALVRQFASALLASRSDALLFRGRCYEYESVPYKGFDGVVDDVGRRLRRMSAERIHALLPKDVSLLERMFPVLSEIQAVQLVAPETRIPPDPLVLRERGLTALGELFARMGERWPLVLVIDDAQWMDAEALLLLESLRRSAPSLLLLITVRGNDECPAEVQEGLAALGATRLALGPLGAESSADLAKLLLSNASPDRAAQVAARGEGHPLFIAELARHASEKNVDLQGALAARVAELEEGPRKLFAMTCIAGRPLSTLLAAEATGLEPEVAGRALKHLRVGRLVRTLARANGSAVEPSHDYVRRAGLALLGPRERQGLHGALAGELERRGGADPEFLTQHFREAGDSSKASGYALLAGRRAARALAFHRAAEFFRDALELDPARPWTEARPIHAELAEALANAGLGAEAGESFLAAVKGAEEAEARRLRLRAAQTFLQSGRIDRGKVVARRVLQDARMGIPRSPAGSLASMLYHRGRISLRGTRFVSRPESEIAPEVLEQVDTVSALSAAMSMVDFIQGADLQARGLRLALNAGERFRVARALADEAVTAAVTEPPPMKRGRRLLAEATRLAGDLDDPYTRAYLHLSRATATLAHFEFREALAEARAADVILREECTGVAWELSTAHHIIGMSLWSMGDYRELSAVLPDYLREARERSDLYGSTTMTASGLFALYLANDDPAGGAAVVESAMAEWAQPPFQLQHYLELEAMSEIDLYVADGRALRRLEDSWSALRRSLLTTMPSAKFVMLTLRARASLDAARADESRQKALLRAAKRDLRRARGLMPNDACEGQVDAIEAALVHAAGDSTKALALLRRACDRLNDAAMHGYAAAMCRRAGELADDGDEVARADAWLREHGVANPKRYAQMRCPGLW
ncbi:MAG: protein kinase [Myxococcota bacterium]